MYDVQGASLRERHTPPATYAFSGMQHGVKRTKKGP